MTLSSNVKNFCLTGMVVLSSICISACSKNYVISTGDGHVITTQGKPVKDKYSGLILYNDGDGNIHRLHQQDIKGIYEI